MLFIRYRHAWKIIPRDEENIDWHSSYTETPRQVKVTIYETTYKIQRKIFFGKQAYYAWYGVKKAKEFYDARKDR